MSNIIEIYKPNSKSDLSHYINLDNVSKIVPVGNSLSEYLFCLTTPDLNGEVTIRGELGCDLDHSIDEILAQKQVIKADPGFYRIFVDFDAKDKTYWVKKEIIIAWKILLNFQGEPIPITPSDSRSNTSLEDSFFGVMSPDGNITFSTRYEKSYYSSIEDFVSGELSEYGKGDYKLAEGSSFKLNLAPVSEETVEEDTAQARFVPAKRKSVPKIQPDQPELSLE